MSENQAFVDMCEDFFNRYYSDEIETLAQKYPRQQRSLVVEWDDMFRFDAEFADDYLNYPGKITEYMEEALAYYPLSVDVDLSGAGVRVKGLHETQEYVVDEYVPENIGEALTVTGQVAQSTQSKPDLTYAVFDCQRCGTSTEIPQADGHEDTIEPHECVGCERQGPFKLNGDQSEFQDAQTIRLQEPPELANGSGDTIDLVLKRELASSGLNGGERIKATGTLSINEHDTDKTKFDYYLDTDAIVVQEGGYDDLDPDEYIDEIDEIRTADDPVAVLLDNFAPSVYAGEKLETIQEALMLQMFGTFRKTKGGEKLRGDSHVLLVGDPSTSKSVLLEEVEMLSPRSRLNSGEGLTAAGVTAAAVKDDFGPGQWALKPGLMVRANEGIACLDEIDKADDSAINSMHQALENQRVTVSKAGMSGEMPARTALLAAANPKYDRFDEYEPIADQIEVRGALMSRFDLMYAIKDVVDEEKDWKMADKVVDSWSASGREEQGEEAVEGLASRPLCDDNDRAVEAMRAYIAKAKQEVQPVIVDDDVKEALKAAWMKVRHSNANNDDAAIPITVRKLEAFLRLAESSARARFADEVTMSDVKRASRLVMSSLEDVGVDPETGEFDADIVETGTSKSQRDRVKTMKTVVEEVEREHDDGAPRSEIARCATEHGIDTDRVDAELQKLAEKGELYEPQDGYYRTT